MWSAKGRPIGLVGLVEGANAEVAHSSSCVESFNDTLASMLSRLIEISFWIPIGSGVLADHCPCPLLALAHTGGLNNIKKIQNISSVILRGYAVLVSL